MRGKTAEDRSLLELLDPVAESVGYEIVRLRLMGGATRRLQIMAERPDGDMNVEDCTRLSRAISEVMDAADPITGEYTLEVSSPGIDRPLTRPKDYARWAGHLARLETAEPVEGRRRFKGTLLGLEGDVVKLRLDDGHETDVPLSAVTRAKLEMTDALIEEHRLAQQGAAQAH